MDLFYYKTEETEKGLAGPLNVTPCDLPSQVKAEALRAVISHDGDFKNEEKNMCLVSILSNLENAGARHFCGWWKTALCMQAVCWMSCG